MKKLITTDTQPSYMDSVMSNFTADLYKRRDEQMLEYIKTNLSHLGYTFENEELFNAFLKERVHAIHYPDKRCEIYLDFIDEHSRGTLIGTLSTEVKIKFDDTNPFKLTATIG